MKNQRKAALEFSLPKQTTAYVTANGQPPAPLKRAALSAPRSTPRRGLNRVEASLYIGVSPSKFDELIKDGRMCLPKRIDGRVIWDIRQLDDAFDQLPSDGDAERNPWDDP